MYTPVTPQPASADASSKTEAAQLLRPVIVAPINSQEKPPEAVSPRVSLRDAVNFQTRFLGTLLTFAVFAVLYVGQAVWIPLMAGVLTNFLFKPFVRRLRSIGVPSVASALVITLAFSALLFIILYRLGEPVVTWIGDAPRHVTELENKARDLSRPFRGLSEAAQEIQKATHDQSTVSVAVQGQPLPVLLLYHGGPVAAMLMTWLMLTFFLLASGDMFLRKLVHVMPGWGQKRDAVEAIKKVEEGVSQFIVLRTLVNILLALATWGAFLWWGVPDAAGWALAVAIVKYVPYVGPMVLTLALAAAGMLYYATAYEAMMPPLVFTVLNTIEEYVLTPWIFGKKLRLNTVAVLVGLMFWGWLWGIPGALMAVPLMVCARIACEHVPGLLPIAEFLSDEQGVELKPDPADAKPQA